jgi:hypothetical protein
VAEMGTLLKLHIPSRGVARIRCVILLTILLAGALVLPAPSNNTWTENVHVSGGPAGIAPKLVFAVDQSTPQLTSLLSQTGVMADLKQLKAGIALSLPDVDTGRAQIVEQLNKAGIPLTAWLALPGELLEGNYRQIELVLLIANPAEMVIRFDVCRLDSERFFWQASLGDRSEFNPGNSAVSWCLRGRAFDFESQLLED